MRNILAALVYLRATSMRNLIVSRIKRLRQPKYLVGAIVGIAYLFLVFGRRFRGDQPSRLSEVGSAMPMDWVSTAETLGALALLTYFVLCWLWPRDRASLAFSEAEIAFLFPAPMSRRTLIHYRLIDSQFRLLFTSLILALVSSRWGFIVDNFALRLIGWWLIFSTIWLHTMGSSFAITKLLDLGVTSLRRQISMVVLIAAVIGAASIWTWNEWRAPSSDDIDGPSGLFAYGTAMLDKGALGVLLTPFRWLVQPLIAHNSYSFLVALWPALLVYGAHYLWVLRSETSFEEASIARAQKRATRIAAIRSGDLRGGRGNAKPRREPFNVSKIPRVEFAFVWKNLLSTAEFLHPRRILIGAAIIAVGCTWLAGSGYETIRRIASISTIILAIYITLFGSMVARMDLRRDLENADILKTYPLQGWQIVLGQILTPVYVVSALLWLVLLAWSLIFDASRLPWLTSDIRVLGAIGAGLLIPLFCAVQVLVLNSMAVLFPAWMQSMRGRAQGIDVVGQRLLFLAALFLSFAGAMLPAALIGGIVFGATYWILNSTIAGALAFLTLLTVLIVEIGLAIAWLGKRFEHFDLSAELRP